MSEVLSGIVISDLLQEVSPLSFELLGFAPAILWQAEERLRKISKHVPELGQLG
jgi:hypothetical protein